MYQNMDTHFKVAKYLTISLGSLGFAFNLLTFIALSLAKTQGMGPYWILLKSLTIADMLTSLQLVLHKALREGYLSDCAYVVAFYPCSPFYVSTYLTLVMIAVNLYLAILHPFKHKSWVTFRRAAVAVTLVWVFSLLVFSSDLLQALYFYMARDEPFCRAFDSFRYGFYIDPVKYRNTFELSWMIFMALVYSGIVYMSVLYIRVYRATKRSAESEPGRQRQENRRTFHTSLLLLGSFMSVYIPMCLAYTCYQVYRTIVLKLLISYSTSEYYDDPRANQLSVVYNYLEIYMEPILVLNTLLDPLIYVVRMKLIRQGFARMFCGRRGKVRRDPDWLPKKPSSQNRTKTSEDL